VVLAAIFVEGFVVPRRPPPLFSVILKMTMADVSAARVCARVSAFYWMYTNTGRCELTRGRDFLLEAGSLRAAWAWLMPNDGSFQIFTARFRVRNPTDAVNAITLGRTIYTRAACSTEKATGRW